MLSTKQGRDASDWRRRHDRCQINRRTVACCSRCRNDIGRVFYFNDGPQTLDFEIGLKPEFQVGDQLWIKPGVAFRTEYLGNFSGSSGEVRYFTKERLDFLFPLTLNASFSIIKNFELVGKYSLDYLGQKEGSFDQKYQAGFMLHF